MRRWLGLLGFVAGCGGAGPVDVGQVVLGLGDVPDEVETISVFVQRVDDPWVVVASATVSAPSTRIALGVPAEVPLEISAVARSAMPAPMALGGRMPVFVARAVRTVPLGNRAFAVALDAREGGGLTIDVDSEGAAGVPLVLEATGEPRPVRFRLPDDRGQLVRALEAGRWSLVSDDEAWVVRGGAGLWVGGGFDTRAAVVVERAVVEGPPRTRLVLGAFDADGEPLSGVVPTSTQSPTVLGLDIGAFDGEARPAAQVAVVARSMPPGLVVPAAAEVEGLPARLPVFQVRGEGRVELRVRVTAADGAVSVARWVANLGRAGGAPVALELDLDDAETLGAGTRLYATLLDAEDRLAEAATWDLDASDSDPWLFFPEGPAAAARGPAVSLPVARPSQPLGLPLSLRAVATSTVFVGTSSATLTLPQGSSRGL